MPSTQGVATNLGGMVNFKSIQYNYLDLQGTSGSGAKTFTVSGQSQGSTSYPIPTLYQGSVFAYIRIKHSVAFVATSLTAMTVSIGKSGGATNFFAGPFDVFQAVADGTLVEVWNPSMGQLSAVTLTATFTPTGANCSAASAGAVNLDLIYYPVTTPTYTGLYGSGSVL